jgi:CheY-like chemotaxis protein
MTLMTTDDTHCLSAEDQRLTGAPAEKSWSQETDGKRKPRVLVVDDEELIAESVAEILRIEGFDAIVAFSGQEGLELVEQLCPDVVLSDVVMPDLDGVEMSIRIQSACPDTRIILFSGQAATTDRLEDAKSRGHQFELLPKPLHPTRLIAAIQKVT